MSPKNFPSAARIHRRTLSRSVAQSLLALSFVAFGVASCTLETGGRGDGITIQSVCGDRWIQDQEDCEKDFPVEVGCDFFGFQQGEVSCSAQCQFDTADCSTCGDGAVDGREQCDGDNLDEGTCSSVIGLPGGDLHCTSQCRFDTSECNRCGNLALEGDEQCDGLVSSDVTCATVTTREEGDVQCAKDCTFDVSNCHTCGDGTAEGPEPCDGADLKGETCTTIGEGAGALACSSDCRLDVGGCFQPPSDWLDVAWQFRRRIRTDPTQVDGPLLHFPLLVRITDPLLGTRAQSDGDDFVFTAEDGKTRVPHEIESWDPATGTLDAWVGADVPSTVPLILRVFYGNPDCADQQTPSAVWDADYAGVWHLNENTVAGGTTKLHRDSTAAERDGQQNGNGWFAGVIGGAQVFDGIDDTIDIANPETLSLGDSNCTVSAWVLTSSTVAMGIVTKAHASTYDITDKILGVNATYGVLGIDHGGVANLAGVTPIVGTTWHHVAWTQKRNASGQLDQWDLYVDGVYESGALTNTQADVGGQTLRFARGVGASVFTNPFAGVMDEVRVSTTARSPRWLVAGVRNQRSPEAFAIVGDEQELGPGL